MDKSIVWVTVPDHETALRLAHQVVDENLAACANIIPGLTSIYTWKGKKEKSHEELLMIKTRSALVEAIITRIKAFHPYEVPEIIAVPIAQGEAAYLRWIEEETG